MLKGRLHARLCQCARPPAYDADRAAQQFGLDSIATASGGSSVPRCQLAPLRVKASGLRWGLRVSLPKRRPFVASSDGASGFRSPTLCSTFRRRKGPFNAAFEAPQKQHAAGLHRLRSARDTAGSEPGEDGITVASNVGGKEDSAAYNEWDSTTETLTALSTLPGLFMMMPQISKNAASLASGNGADLAILSWLAFSTGFFGNMLLLSYFTHQKQLSACLVQVVGAATTLILLSQVWLAGFMPSSSFAAAASFFLLGCLVNGLRFASVLPDAIWSTWQDLIGVLGLAVLPQVLWSSFFTSPTLLPGVAAASAALFFLAWMRLGTVPEWLTATWQKLSGWTATLLFMFMPVAQLQACIVQPQKLAGMSALSSMLCLLGNSLMIPRALFTRDLIWFTGSSWGATMMGWGVLLAMTLNGFFSKTSFSLASLIYVLYLTFVVMKNTAALGLNGPLSSLQNLF